MSIASIMASLADHWNLLLATNSGKSLNISQSSAFGVYGTGLSSDGTKAYACDPYTGAGAVPSTIYQYTLSTPRDISTGTYASKSLVVNPTGASSGSYVTYFGFSLSSDGTKLYTGSSTAIYQYNLSVAWDISTAAYASKLLSIGYSATSVTFSPDGLFMFTADGVTNIRQYTLSVAWDITTASITRTLSTSGTITSAYSTVFSRNGSDLYISDIGSNKIYQYFLTAPYNLSTATYSGRSLSATGISGLAFSSDSTKLYMWTLAHQILEYYMP